MCCTYCRSSVKKLNGTFPDNLTHKISSNGFHGVVTVFREGFIHFFLSHEVLRDWMVLYDGCTHLY